MKDSGISTVKSRTGKRAFIVIIAFMLFAAYLVVNIFRLDVLMYGYYKDKAFDQITTTSPLKANRGSIYDANMNLLASSKTSWRIFVSTREINAKASDSGIDYAGIISKGIAAIFNSDEEKIRKKITNTATLDVTLVKEASEEEYNAVMELIEDNNLDGMLLCEAQSTRYYPEGTLAAHLLGFTGSDGQGLYGIEYSYNSTLSGRDGYYLYAKDANGQSMPGEYSAYVGAEDGYSLITTLDSFVQQRLESILEAIVVNHSVNNRVTGVVMNTSTGAILAMATSSPFDPNEPFELDSLSMKKLNDSGLIEGSDEYKALKTELLQVMWSNKAISETYEPGSTFKIITVASALDKGVAKESDTFSCHGYLQVGGWRIKCHKAGGHGSGFNLAYGLQMSCNPTMMQIASRIGASDFYDYVEAFGYFEKTGIDLPSEASTIFHEKDNIGVTELATASFGQRFKVSVISQLTAISAISNGGRLVTPYVVDKVIDKNGNIITQHETQIRRQVVSEDVANTVARILEEGVSGEGGAKNAYVDGYSIAAKTGTSEKFDVLDANGKSYLRIGSTVAFSISDKEDISVIIMVDEPMSQVKYGSTVAAPYISMLMEDILPYLEYSSSKEKSEAIIDSYVGMNIASAKKQLDESKINYKVIGDGSVVLAQTPSAGVEVDTALSCIYLYTVDTVARTVTVPELTGLSLNEANRLAVNSGLNISITGVKDKEYGDRLTVTSQSLEVGSNVPLGTVVVLYAINTEFED